MNLNYTPQAVADLDAIHAYIASENPRIADQVIARILQSMAVIESFPMIGRPGRIADTREWFLAGLPYVGIYTIADETEIDVLTIVHTRRQWPPAQV